MNELGMNSIDLIPHISDLEAHRLSKNPVLLVDLTSYDCLSAVETLCRSQHTQPLTEWREVNLCCGRTLQLVKSTTWSFLPNRRKGVLSWQLSLSTFCTFPQHYPTDSQNDIPSYTLHSTFIFFAILSSASSVYTTLSSPSEVVSFATDKHQTTGPSPWS